MKKMMQWVLTTTLTFCGASLFTACTNDDNSVPVTPVFDASKYALVDLHLHLDGSLSVDDAIYMASVEHVSLPTSKNEIEKLLVCPENCESLTEYLKCFDLPVSIMQSRETIAYSVKSLVKRLDQQGLIYAEIRYAPQLHTEKGLTQDEVTAASIEGLREGLAESKNGIKAQLILCCMRGEGNDDLNKETVDVAKKYFGQGVCAIDIAGAEALFPTSKYRELFAYAKAQDIPFTIHAGEADGIESMMLAVEYGAKRIGHGIRAFNDAEMKQILKQNDICLTLSPTSNLQTKALTGVTQMSQYPLQAFLADGVPVCINTDNMTVSGTTVRQELQKLYDAGILTTSQAELMVRTAINHAFLPEADKTALLSKAEKIIL
ncbi:MAG: adenosine deaminase [Prevotella sp.]|nr:adenosine deaminase [Prevotella sp.]